MSKEYIDKAGLLALIKCLEDVGFKRDIGIIEEFPTVDAVEVVRCKDCKHKKRYDVGFGGKYIVCGYDGIDKGDMEFCNRGEKKNEDE